MQTGSIRSGAKRVVLPIALVATIVFSVSVYSLQSSKMDELAGQLAAQSATITEQGRKIEQDSLVIESQKQEISSKSVQLVDLQGRIDDLSKEIESQQQVIAKKTSEAEKLQADLAGKTLELGQLQSQATKLQSEIGALQSEIKAKDNDIAELILEKNASRRVHIAYYGLGVSDDGKGIVFPIEAEIIGSGSGRISVDVSNVQYEASFQGAVRTAVAVASEYTGVSVANKDIIVRLVNTGDGLIQVDGPSAGAAITAIMVAGLSEKEIDSSVLVTGTIRSDGTIGKIGGLSSKADAAAAFGAKKLLVPAGQEFSHGQMEILGVADVRELASHLIKG